jgi:hypothetical protein
MVLIEEQGFFEECKLIIKHQQQVGLPIDQMPLIIGQCEFSRPPVKSQKGKRAKTTLLNIGTLGGSSWQVTFDW